MVSKWPEESKMRAFLDSKLRPGFSQVISFEFNYYLQHHLLSQLIRILRGGLRAGRLGKISHRKLRLERSTQYRNTTVLNNSVDKFQDSTFFLKEVSRASNPRP